MGASRNDPCPCGSGKKYKKCCAAKDEAAQPRHVVPAELEVPDLLSKIKDTDAKIANLDKEIEARVQADADEHLLEHLKHYGYPHTLEAALERRARAGSGGQAATGGKHTSSERFFVAAIFDELWRRHRATAAPAEPASGS